MKVNDITKQAIVATIYIVLSIALSAISFLDIQLRVAEMLMVLPFYNKKYTIGLTIGCLITNLSSPLGLLDIVLGTLATFLACLIISNLKTKIFIPIVAAAINGVIVSFVLYYTLGLPLLFSFVTVSIGEFIAVAIGVLAVSYAEKNEFVKNIIKI